MGTGTFTHLVNPVFSLPRAFPATKKLSFDKNSDFPILLSLQHNVINL